MRRRPRNTAKPPANIVRPAIAEAGSISGALTGEEGEEGEDGKQTGNQRIWKHCCESPPLEADAMPAMVINTSAKLIFRTTVRPSS
jgi:hypothetical protein